ncbi:TetR/AcrR family transcriptional regulator [Georgenia subflava]|uniref:TetR family transcriptional regulator n=1 Tax=Georgenia subflava TaxID=1622177 RepID=A0A6N7EK35_9MICO|nr:TetR family transcriptional regulator [Georgenia subflava]MPV37423.1 TetR family transcriptional regulator [Georgenia subflava]
MPTAPRGRGRRPGGPDTRTEILDAARTEFAERSYAGTTVRAVAARAGVDPALVHHYFGTKRDLFVASLELRLDPAEVVENLEAVPVEQRGTVLVRTFFSVWDDAARRAPFVALIRSATSDPQAARMLRQFIEQVMLPAVRPLVPPGPDVDLRLQLAVSHLIGAALLRNVVGAQPLASAGVDEVTAYLSPTVQGYLTPR